MSKMMFVSPLARVNLAGDAGVEIGNPRDGCVPRRTANSLVKRGLARVIRDGETERVVTNQLDLFPDDGW